MKRHLILTVAAIQFILSGCGSVLKVEVSNAADFDRDTDIIEVPWSDVEKRLGIRDGESVVLKDGSEEVPYQLTYDGKLIFPTKLLSGQTKTYSITKGAPSEYTVKVCGDHYPQRVDDICWENDLIGFRTYGFKEDAPSGYDIFTKRSSDLPVIPEFYRRAKDPKLTKIHKQLKKTDKRAADRFNWDSLSFHVDHGYGCDVYAVGPTLGAGTSALLDGENIVFHRKLPDLRAFGHIDKGWKTLSAGDFPIQKPGVLYIFYAQFVEPPGGDFGIRLFIEVIQRKPGISSCPGQSKKQRSQKLGTFAVNFGISTSDRTADGKGTMTVI